MTSRFWYAVIEDDPDTRHECSQNHYLPRPLEAQSAAEDAADDYYANHDGWESPWPLIIALYETEDGPEIARYLVELEHEPAFYARQCEAPETPR